MQDSTPARTPESVGGGVAPPPWELPAATAATAISAVQAAAEQRAARESAPDRRLPTSHSAPVTGLSALSAPASKLPKAQNPTITLLQKARGRNFI